MAEQNTIQIENYFTEENLEETIRGPWVKIYEHYCTTNFDLTSCPLTLYLNTIRSYYNFLTSKKLILHHLKRLYADCSSNHNFIIATDIFGAVYFLVQINAYERGDISQGICKCCDYDDPLYITPLGEWIDIYNNEGEEFILEAMQNSMDNLTATMLSPSNEEIQPVQQSEEITPPLAPKEIFEGFTDAATQEDLESLKQMCQLEEEAAKNVIATLVEFDAGGIIDIHGWTKRKLFNELKKIGLTCSENNFYKAFKSSDDHIVKNKKNNN